MGSSPARVIRKPGTRLRRSYKVSAAVLAVACCLSIRGGAQPYDIYQLTHDPVAAGHASWSPDGSMIAYNSGEYGSRDIWIIPSAGGGTGADHHTPGE